MALVFTECNTTSEKITVTNTADAIYYNGDIITMDGDSAIYAESVAIKDDRIIFVGSKNEVEKLKDNSTVMNDLKGKTMLPGFIDACTHPYIEASILTNTLHKNGITTACEQTCCNADIDFEKKIYTQEINKPTTHYRLLLVPNAMNLYNKLKSADKVFVYCDSLIKTGTSRLNYIKITNAYIDAVVFIEFINTRYPEQQLIMHTFLKAGWDMHVYVKDNTSLDSLLSIINDTKLQTPNYTSQIMLESDDLLSETQYKKITDANVIVYHNLYSIMPSPPLQYVCAVTNKTSGMPQSNINLWTAMKAITFEAARSIRKEKEIGTIAVGKKADFVLLAQNPFKIAPAKIKDYRNSF